MTLSNIKTLKRDRGFTIVELLIVIVVIAILAAITIVAYNGVQNRARDTNNKTDAVSLVKVAEAVNADTGAYPSAGGTPSTANLIASFNSGTTAKIPSGVDIQYATAPPTNANAVIAADQTPHLYTVWPCAAGTNIYYPSRAAGAIQVAKAGAGC